MRKTYKHNARKLQKQEYEKQIRQIQRTTSSFYDKKGNCNSMCITYNRTSPRYNMNTLEHYRSTDNTKLSSKNLARYINFTK